MSNESRIRLTLHAALRLARLSELGIEVNEAMIADILANPEKVEVGKYGRLIAQGPLDDRHVLRIVYEQNPDELVVITVNPGRRSRYG